MKSFSGGGKRKNRLALTLLFSGVIFLFLLVTMLFSGTTMYFLMQGKASETDLFASGTKSIIFMTVWSILLGSLLSLVLGRISLNPINKVIDAMNRLAGGDFKTRLCFGMMLSNHPTGLEVTDSFNHMAEELEKTEMLRSDFVNNFSHEFKTPIVSIAGFADLLMEEKLSDEEEREYIRIISEESHRLSEMATNVLSLTKIENQKILTGVTRFNLSEQIRSCLLLTESKWTEKNLDLDLDFDEYDYTGNKELLKQVWLNLIDNAVKFSDEGGRLRVAIRETAGELLVSVENNGREIPADKIEYIFNKFYQADESHATQGNGIGLSVAKAVAELHGGSILAASGNGKTSFTVVLPKKHVRQ